ncbi:LysR family transcriptional regulator [Delftia sp. PS-11]|uniref:LysR family transcriptional regulator n=1 Tax=Delftia sp. PS-11 TaxID=2767222 RepID=UPI002453BB4E|nr:LysR family transcriptional regulator [Delftia sp. PS-11]KAJ8745526.1 LysR family transcriptional regulator [Delftia sp. PS-11]
MRFNQLDLNLLVALDALLTEQSISRAAEKIHLSQSAMSNALARLRAYFDDELLVQVGRRMEPTPRADLLKDAVRDILVRVEATVAQQPRFEPAQSNRLFRLLVSDYTAMTLMPHLLELAYRQAPSVRFDLRHQVANPQRMLERGEADLLIIPKDFCSGDHPAQPLFEERFCCVVWARSRMAEGTLNEARYLSASHVVVQPGDGVALADWFMQQLGVHRHADISTFSFLSQAQLVVGTERIATMHERLARKALRFLPVVTRELPLRMPCMTQMVQWHQHRTTDPGLLWLRALLHDAVAAMDADPG